MQNTSNNTYKAIAPIRKGMKPYLEMGEIVKKDNNPNYVPKIPIAEPKLKTIIIPQQMSLPHH